MRCDIHFAGTEKEEKVMKKERWNELFQDAENIIDREELRKSSEDFVGILGEHTMMLKAIEELAELQQAVSKCNRMRIGYEKGISTKEEVNEAHRNLIEEMGDVLVQMGNLSYIFGVSDEEVLKAANVKITAGEELRQKNIVR